MASGARRVVESGRTSRSRRGPGAEPRPPEAAPLELLTRSRELVLIVEVG